MRRKVSQDLECQGSPSHGQESSDPPAKEDSEQGCWAPGPEPVGLTAQETEASHPPGEQAGVQAGHTTQHPASQVCTQD